MLLQISFWVMKFPTWNSYRQTSEDFPWLTGKEIRNLLRLSFTSLEAEEVASAFPSQLLCVKYRNHSTWLMRLNSSFVRFKTWFSAFISRFGLPEKTKSQSTIFKNFSNLKTISSLTYILIPLEHNFLYSRVQNFIVANVLKVI